MIPCRKNHYVGMHYTQINVGRALSAIAHIHKNNRRTVPDLRDDICVNSLNDSYIK
jgi:hypothetical protein